MKQAIDARDGDEAAKYVDFESVVRNAGREMVAEAGWYRSVELDARANAAIDLLTKPMAQVAKSAAIQKVDDGAREVQMPALRSRARLYCCIETATLRPPTSPTTRASAGEYTWRAGGDGYWRVTEIEDIEQLLQKLQHNQPMGTP